MTGISHTGRRSKGPCETQEGQSAHQGVFRLMAEGGPSRQAFMHHVPFSRKHVRQHSDQTFRRNIPEMVPVTCSLPPATDGAEVGEAGSRSPSGVQRLAPRQDLLATDVFFFLFFALRLLWRQRKNIKPIPAAVVRTAPVFLSHGEELHPASNHIVTTVSPRPLGSPLSKTAGTAVRP